MRLVVTLPIWICSKTRVLSENTKVPVYKNVKHIAADVAIPGNLMFSDFAGLHTFNPIANLTGSVSKDTIYSLGR